MRFHKRLNNNVVVAVDEQGEEQVLFGRGLGFGLSIGSTVDMERVERIYVLKGGPIPALPGEAATPADPTNPANPANSEYLEIAAQIYDDARETIPVEISESIIAPLADHIGIAVRRERERFHLRNMMLQEVQRFYRDEFIVGRRAVELVNTRFAVALGDDEARFIALHLVGAELGANEGSMPISTITGLIHEIESIVRMHYMTAIDPESEAYRRFMTHLKFFSERLTRRQASRASDVGGMLVAVNDTYPGARECVERIRELLAAKYEHSLTDDERLYLTIHVAHIMQSSE